MFKEFSICHFAFLICHLPLDIAGSSEFSLQAVASQRKLKLELPPLADNDK
jgi:hypothetical protein